MTPEKTPWRTNVISDSVRFQMVSSCVYLIVSKESHVCCTSNSDPEDQPSTFEAKVPLLGRKQHGVRVPRWSYKRRTV